MRVKLREVPKVAREAAVAVTSRCILCLLAVICHSLARAAVLDDDRVDILYQMYDGGGTKVEAPAIVVRKKLAESVAVSGHYLVDMVSGASIDVEVGASPYEEKRTEYGAAVEYLKDKAVVSLGYANSSENDYQAESFSLGVSQDFFGDMSTVSLALGLGNDVIESSTDSGFEEQAKHTQLTVGLTQVLHKNLIANLSLNKTVDEGYLQNPYRFIRYIDPDNPDGWLADQETYPQTRSSDAWSLRGRYSIGTRKVLYASVRQFQDSWGINAWNGEIGFNFALFRDWLFDIRYRHYRQNEADFYRDLFDYPNQSNFQARDKELSAFSSRMISLSAAWELPLPYPAMIKKSTLHLMLDHIQFRYDNFRDAREDTLPAGSEPLYEFDANLLRLMLSIGF